MSEKIMTLLGFASKAGKLSFGMSAAVDAVKAKKARLLIVSSDVSPKSLKEINFYGEKYDLPVKVLGEDMQRLSLAVGRKCGILSVNDEGFASSVSSQEETI